MLPSVNSFPRWGHLLQCTVECNSSYSWGRGGGTFSITISRGPLEQLLHPSAAPQLQGGSNMTGTDLFVNKPHCAAAVRLAYTQISPGHIWTTLYYFKRKSETSTTSANGHHSQQYHWTRASITSRVVTIVHYQESCNNSPLPAEL